ncbi:acetyl-CoA hydrolase/transferase C-terminal domain-containing protein [Marinimicrobium sp. C2-29]|uniref:acetyl-CoA hydrolase/transferase C-terminal domain-containing protein n=1 Tax=Marinimicrobium sp. C2-29 TaxID=3139825 RepID=UPI00313A4CBD
MSTHPRIHSDGAALIDAIIATLGKRIVVGLPLGLGKANHLINELYRRACQDPELELVIFTALTLEAPVPGSELEKRFLGPISQRLFDDYPALEYARDMRHSALPENVTVRDFYLAPGAWLNSPIAQQSYTSINYTHALDALIRAGVNLVLQLVAPADPDRGERYSLSCNPDITVDLLEQRRAGKIDFICAAQVNGALPFLGGEADREAGDFDHILQSPDCEFPLYSPPHKPVSKTDYAIGLQVARLVPDGGTLQIGIGSIGDAIAQGLLLREQNNALFKQLIRQLGEDDNPELMHTGVFEQGLYGVTEMLVEGFLALLQAGILRRTVGGAAVHGGFFVGSPVFYRLLEQLSPQQRDQIAMMPVSFTNTIGDSLPYRPDEPERSDAIGRESAKREARVGARFINSAMMATLNGSVVSDGLEDGRVVSGVGGQYNFVSQAFDLPGARAIITLPATRTKKGQVKSNILWNYGHTTLPRHLRDIIVTEYGVADLRDKSDAEVMAAMLGIADSRFQPELLKCAQAAGKLPDDYQIPERFRQNTPERIHSALAEGYQAQQLPAFPLGSGLSDDEEHLAKALAKLAPQVGDWRSMAALVIRGWRRPMTERMRSSLQRMQLEHPKGARERLYRALLVATLED